MEGKSGQQDPEAKMSHGLYSQEAKKDESMVVLSLLPPLCTTQDPKPKNGVAYTPRVSSCNQNPLSKPHLKANPFQTVLPRCDWRLLLYMIRSS